LLIVLDQIRISIITMSPEEGLQGVPVFLDECLVRWAHRVLTGCLLDRSSVALDFTSFPVVRFIAQNDDIGFESGNVFDDKRIVLRRD
jgi:hypothetical protein